MAVHQCAGFSSNPKAIHKVHQCARFSSNLKAIHELAIKQIVRYLFATKDKGLIMRPASDLTQDMYVDSNFAGMWHKEHSQLRNNVNFRMGFVITFGGCPVT
jgi:hypothetical protein